MEQLRKTGRLLREKAITIANRHNASQIDEARIFEFDGLVIEAYFPNRDTQGGLVSQVRVTKSYWPMQFGLRVGASAQKVREILGEPDEQDVERLKYCGDTACGVFLLRNGRVMKAIFDSPVD